MVNKTTKVETEHFIFNYGYYIILIILVCCYYFVNCPLFLLLVQCPLLHFKQAINEIKKSSITF